MDISLVMQSMVTSCKTLLAAWPVKMLIAICMSVLSSTHAIAFYLFVILICFDLVAKLIALSRKRLIDMYGHSYRSDTWEAIRPKNLRAAQREQYISSTIMKHRFGGKIILYFFVTVSAVCMDWFAMNAFSSNGPFLIYIIWAYLGVSEFISILENLQYAGIDEAEKLNHFVRNLDGVSKLLPGSEEKKK